MGKSHLDFLNFVFVSIWVLAVNTWCLMLEHQPGRQWGKPFLWSLCGWVWLVFKHQAASASNYNLHPSLGGMLTGPLADWFRKKTRLFLGVYEKWQNLLFPKHVFSMWGSSTAMIENPVHCRESSGSSPECPAAQVQYLVNMTSKTPSLFTLQFLKSLKTFTYLFIFLHISTLPI